MKFYFTIRTGWWYGNFSFYGHSNGVECCALDSVSFHYADDAAMHAYEIIYYGMEPNVVGLCCALNRLKGFRPIFQSLNIALADRFVDRVPVLLQMYQTLFFDQLRFQLAAGSNTLSEHYFDNFPDIEYALIFRSTRTTCDSDEKSCSNQPIWRCRPPSSSVQTRLMRLLFYTNISGRAEPQQKLGWFLLNME